MLKKGRARVRAKSLLAMLAVLTTGGFVVCSGAAVLASGGGRPKAPEKLKHVGPTYPPAACAASVEGDVGLECTRTATGQVRACRVVKGTEMLNRAAIDAVEQWVYVASKHDRPVRLNVRFRLSDAPESCGAGRK
jgi:TonB family protein